MSYNYKHEEEHHHHHHHDISDMSATKVFWTVLLNLFISLTELIGGLFSHSLALVSDSFHNFSDTASIALTYVAIRISKRQTDVKMTFGYKRAQILVAFINSSALIVISVFLVIEAIKRFSSPEQIQSNLMIIVASVGLVANLVSVLLLSKDSHHNMNVKSSYLHLISDTISSVGVVLGGFAIKFWQIYWIDPVITILIALYILKEAWFIVKKSVEILMEGSADLDYENIKRDIEKIDNIINIHHIHSWYGDEKTIYFEAHVVLKNIMISETKMVLKKIEGLLRDKYGITHTTIQFESEETDCPDEIISKFKTVTK